MFSLPHTDHVVPKAYSNGPDLAIPVSLLLDIYNALPDAHHTKSLITDYIVAFAATNDKAHWTRAVVRKPDGSLVFDETLWDVAVYLGKQETRMKASEKAFEELRDQLDLLGSFYESEKSLLAQIAPVGEPLLQMPKPSLALHHVRQHAEALRVLVNDMQSGLANNIASTTVRASIQNLDQRVVDNKEGLVKDL